jgi:hypothetical protein
MPVLKNLDSHVTYRFYTVKDMRAKTGHPYDLTRALHLHSQPHTFCLDHTQVSLQNDEGRAIRYRVNTNDR